MIKKFLIGTFAVAALAFAMTASAAYDFGTTTLKVGSKDTAAVKVLQTLVGATPVDGIFGQGTAAKVKVWQAANGLTADGVFGPASKAKANAAGGVVTLPSGCQPGWAFNPATGTACTTVPGTPAQPGVGALKGGAGDLTLSSTNTDEEGTVNEDSSEKVLAFKGEADGSDIAVTSVKLVLANTSTGSERLTDYIDSVKVYLGSKEVGSADASDFSRDSGSPDIFSQTIALSNAVVKEGDKETFFVEVTTVDTIDTPDQSADWTIALDAIRYTDATGVILSESGIDGVTANHYSTDNTSYDETFTFDDASTDDSLKIKVSASDPDASTIEVLADENSDEVLIGAFKLEVDKDSSDITINELPVTVTFANGGTSADSADSVIDTLSFKIDGGSGQETELGSDSVTNGVGTAEYSLSFDADEMVIDSGDTVEVKVYATFKDQDGNYASGTTVKVSADADNIDAEGKDDLTSSNTSGVYTGDTHTLSVDAPMFNLTKVTFEKDQSIDGVAAGEEDIFLAKFVFTVTAPSDTDVYLSSAASDITITSIGGGVVSSKVLDASDVDEDAGSYLIGEGENEEFTVSVYVRGNNASEKVTITGFKYGLDAGETDLSVTSGLTDFKTTTKFLAK